MKTKALAAFLGWLAAAIFPTPVLIQLLYCLFAVAFLDGVTGIRAAVALGTPVTIKKFWTMGVDKCIRGVAYLGLAVVASKLIQTGMAVDKPVAEPIGMALAMLIATDGMSIVKNLADAHLNIPLLDKYLGPLLDNLRTTKEGTPHG